MAKIRVYELAKKLNMTNKVLLSKLKAITPAAVASAFNIKVSAAEDLLETWEKRNLVIPVAKCERLKIYKPNMAVS